MKSVPVANKAYTDAVYCSAFLCAYIKFQSTSIDPIVTAKTITDLHIFLKSFFIKFWNSFTLTRWDISIFGSLFTLFCDMNRFLNILVKVFMLFNNFFGPDSCATDAVVRSLHTGLGNVTLWLQQRFTWKQRIFIAIQMLLTYKDAPLSMDTFGPVDVSSSKLPIFVILV